MIEKMGINYYYDGPVSKLDIIKDDGDIKQVKTFSGHVADLLNNILCGPEMVISTTIKDFEALGFTRRRKIKPRKKKEEEKVDFTPLFNAETEEEGGDMIGE